MIRQRKNLIVILEEMFLTKIILKSSFSLYNKFKKSLAYYTKARLFYLENNINLVTIKINIFKFIQ